MLAAVKQARENVRSLRMALEGPSAEEIGAALPGLQEAVNHMETLEQEIRAGRLAPHDVRRELQFLKSDLKVTGRLIEHGVAFCQGWSRLLGAGPSYTYSGQEAEPAGAARGTLSLEG